MNITAGTFILHNSAFTLHPFRMRRFSFLSVFLTCLSIAFAIALVVRIRSYSRIDEAAARLPQETTQPGAIAVGDATAVPAETPAIGTVVPVTTSRNATAAATLTRAQRREQLIREAQAAAATQPNAQPVAPVVIAKTPVKPTPVFSRVVSPPVARAASARPVAQSPSHQSSSGSGQSGRGGGPKTETAPKDPNSDTAAPQLVSIEFDPPQVHDGEEARVIMTAVDDLSGLRGISGTITSPTGKALQGFAGQREGDGTRYIGRLAIPKNGEEGLWRVNVLTMSDNASNSVTLSAAQGGLPPTAVLRVVSSQSDSTPPTLKSVRPEKRTMRAGEPNPIYIEAEDDKSGVNLVTAVFQSPNKRARIGTGCRRPGDGNVWQCEITLPSCIDCGEWQLEQVTLQDKANNLATYRLDNPLVAEVKINIGGDSCDSEAPRLSGVALDQAVVTMGNDAATVTVTVNATDDACGVSGVSGQYTGPSPGSGGFFPFQQSGDATTWVGRIPLDPRAPRGLWRINSIQLTDKGHNLRIYYANDPLLANGAFQVR